MAINPNDPDAYGLLGVSFFYDGEPEKGLAAMEEHLRRDPFGPDASAGLGQIAIAHYLRGDYEAAVVSARRAIRLFPGYNRHRWLAAALGQLGRIDEASEALAEAAALGPDDLVRQRPPWLRHAKAAH